MTKRGVVYLVGAGPGDPGLLTCRGLQCLQRAEVVVYDGLVAVELLSHVQPGCELVYAGKKRSARGGPRSQEQINALLVERAGAGKIVTRLKGGDPFVFGRGAEECLALDEAGIRFEVVPGVSSATAVPAYAGIPLTARGVSATATLVTGHEAPGKAASDVNWQAIAGNQTIVLFMAWKEIQRCVDALLAAGRAADSPAAAIRWGTTALQTTLRTSLAELPEAIRTHELRPPVLVVIGDVVDMDEALRWYEKRPLFGKRVLLTRGHDRAEPIATALRDLGAQTIVAATTQIEEPSEEQAHALSAAMASLKSYDWLFFTSANGVHACAKALGELGLDSRALAGLKIAAVGTATCAALNSRGLRADLLTQGDGRSLAHALSKEAGPPKRILFPRAEGGREEPIEVLTAAGSQVDLRIAYRSVPRAAQAPDLEHALELLRTGSLEAVAFFAPSQVHALCALEPRAPEYLAQVPVLGAIGRTTARALQELGLEVQALPEKPTGRLLADAIAQAFS